MKKFFLSITFFLLLYTNVYPHVDHYKKLSYIEYELFRNNASIGYHKYNFLREKNNLTVDSTVEFSISKLGIQLYKYFAKSTEVYKNDKFFSFSSRTLQNKKDKYVNISVNINENNLKIDGSSYKGPTSIDHIVGTWWNHEIVSSKAQISAISGRVIEQNVIFLGKEEVKIGEKVYKTLKFNFKSSDETLPENKKLNTYIWYEENTYLWVKAEFKKQGNWEYRIKIYK